MLWPHSKLSPHITSIHPAGSTQGILLPGGGGARVVLAQDPEPGEAPALVSFVLSELERTAGRVHSGTDCLVACTNARGGDAHQAYMISCVFQPFSGRPALALLAPYVMPASIAAHKCHCQCVRLSPTEHCPVAVTLRAAGAERGAAVDCGGVRGPERACAAQAALPRARAARGRAAPALQRGPVPGGHARGGGTGAGRPRRHRGQQGLAQSCTSLARW